MVGARKAGGQANWVPLFIWKVAVAKLYNLPISEIALRSPLVNVPMKLRPSTVVSVSDIGRPLHWCWYASKYSMIKFNVIGNVHYR